MKFGTMKQAEKYNADHKKHYTDIMVPVRYFDGKKYEYSGTAGFGSKQAAKSYAERMFVPKGFNYRVVISKEEGKKTYLLYARRK